MTNSEIVAALVAKGYGVLVDSGDDGVDEQDEPYLYHVGAMTGEHGSLATEMGRYGHDWEEALRGVWEEAQE